MLAASEFLHRAGRACSFPRSIVPFPPTQIHNVRTRRSCEGGGVGDGAGAPAAAAHPAAVLTKIPFQVNNFFQNMSLLVINPSNSGTDRRLEGSHIAFLSGPKFVDCTPVCISIVRVCICCSAVISFKFRRQRLRTFGIACLYSRLLIPCLLNVL